MPAIQVTNPLSRPESEQGCCRSADVRDGWGRARCAEAVTDHHRSLEEGVSHPGRARLVVKI